MAVVTYWVEFKDLILKISCQYLYYWLRYRVNKENRHIVVRPTYPKLTQYPGSSMRVLMYWVDPKDHMLKVLCHYIYYWLRYRVNQENRPIVIRPTHLKLTQIPRVIHDIFDVVGTPQGSYAESLALISLLFAEI